MTFATLALITAAGLVGPLVAGPSRLRAPLVVGELCAGLFLGRTGIHVLHPADQTFSFLASIGFALVMFLAGSHVPLRDARLVQSLGRASARAAGIGVLAAGIGWLLARGFHTGHGALYAVLIASSSAALILPLVDHVAADAAKLDLLAQVAVADTACIVALPLAIEPRRAATAALGAVLVIASAAVAFVGLRAAERSGWRQRVHDLSERREFALELRISLLVLFLLAALASWSRVSIMLAGFSLGLAVTAVGEPRRLARQLFGLTEGFFGPLFFVWLGSTLDLRALGTHPRFIGLGVALGCCAIAAHASTRLTRQPIAMGVVASAQLGVPVAAVALGAEHHLFGRGEPAALLLGAVLTIVAASVAAGRLDRTGTRARA